MKTPPDLQTCLTLISMRKKEVRRPATDALVEFGPAAVPYLVKIIENKNSSVFSLIGAANALGRIGDMSAFPAVFAAAKARACHQEQFMALLGALGGLPDESAIDFLRSIMLNPTESNQVRLEAAKAISGQGIKALVPVLEYSVKSSPSSSDRRVIRLIREKFAAHPSFHKLLLDFAIPGVYSENPGKRADYSELLANFGHGNDAIMHLRKYAAANPAERFQVLRQIDWLCEAVLPKKGGASAVAFTALSAGVELKRFPPRGMSRAIQGNAGAAKLVLA